MRRRSARQRLIYLWLACGCFDEVNFIPTINKSIMNDGFHVGTHPNTRKTTRRRLAESLCLSPGTVPGSKKEVVALVRQPSKHAFPSNVTCQFRGHSVSSHVETKDR